MPKRDPSTFIGEGQKALASAQWVKAKDAFEAAIQSEDTPDAHDGCGIALWWLNEIKASHEHRMMAYKGFKEIGDFRRAALIAAWLAREQVFLNQNPSAMNGWFARAERLLHDVQPCVEQGWFKWFYNSMMAPPNEMERVMLEIIETARQFADTDLEVAALAFVGQARVAQGFVEEGMNQLDEAMAAATGGEVASFMIISEVFCVTLSACETSGDWVRTEHWCRAANDFAQRYHCTFLSAYCRTTYGGLLTATGRWQEAESELTEAIRIFGNGHRGLKFHAVLKLSDLRVYQGRFEEAELLLRGLEDEGEARLPLARLYLARHEPELARAVLEQVLGQSVPTLAQAPALLLWMDVSLALGNLDAARQAADQLSAIAEQTKNQLLFAQADLAKGHISRDVNQDEAVEYFRSALNRLHQYEQSLLASRVKFELAQTLSDQDRPAAITWARAALATFERLGAVHEADETAKLLRSMGVTGRANLPRQESLTQREAEVLALLARGLSNREIAERLVISAKTVEHHVSQVLGKLGLRSRAEVAAYVASQSSIKK